MLFRAGLQIVQVRKANKDSIDIIFLLQVDSCQLFVIKCTIRMGDWDCKKSKPPGNQSPILLPRNPMDYLNTISQCNAAELPLQDNSIDLCVTSPPYSDLRLYSGYTFDFPTIAAQLFRVIRTGGVLVWVVGDTTENGSETGEPFRQALYFKGLGFNLYDTMIYKKKGLRFPEQKRYYNIFEYMLILSKGQPKTVNLLKDRKNAPEWLESNGKKRSHMKRNKDGSFTGRKAYVPQEYGVRWNIWEYEIGGGKGNEKAAYAHPAVFPDALARDHILSWSNPGDIVLDPMCGSGTTLKMAKELGRHWIGFDISSEYVKLAKERVAGANPPLFT